MRNNRYSFILRLGLLVAIFVLPILLLTNVAHAAQQPPPITAKWIFELSFSNGQIQARRINQLFQGKTLTAQWDQSINCQKNGPVAIGASSATFSGGYLNCFLPSFKDEVQMYTQSAIILKNTCSIGGTKVDVWGQATLRNVDFTKANRHPIFSHPAYSMAYAVEKDGAGAIMVLDAGSESEQSSPFVFTSAADTLGSRIHECDGNTCTSRHILNGSEIDNDQIPQVATWSVTTGATTLFVGREGTGRFYGELFSLRDDPGCVAQPG
jgi:hypothetical protein